MKILFIHSLPANVQKKQELLSGKEIKPNSDDDGLMEKYAIDTNLLILPPDFEYQ